MNRTDYLMLPKRRQARLMLESVGSQTIVYDLDSCKVHCLNALSSLIWQSCDGERSVQQIIETVRLHYPGAGDQEMVLSVVQRLSWIGLLEEEWEALEAEKILSRRAMAKRLGKAVASAAPLITTVVAPAPAKAGSLLSSGSPCSTSAQCQSGICFNGRCL